MNDESFETAFISIQDGVKLVRAQEESLAHDISLPKHSDAPSILALLVERFAFQKVRSEVLEPNIVHWVTASDPYLPDWQVSIAMNGKMWESGRPMQQPWLWKISLFTF